MPNIHCGHTVTHSKPVAQGRNNHSRVHTQAGGRESSTKKLEACPAKGRADTDTQRIFP